MLLLNTPETLILSSVMRLMHWNIVGGPVLFLQRCDWTLCCHGARLVVLNYFGLEALLNNFYELSGSYFKNNFTSCSAYLLAEGPGSGWRGIGAGAGLSLCLSGYLLIPGSSLHISCHPSKDLATTRRPWHLLAENHWCRHSPSIIFLQE